MLSGLSYQFGSLTMLSQEPRRASKKLARANDKLKYSNTQSADPNYPTNYTLSPSSYFAVYERRTITSTTTKRLKALFVFELIH
jgi:hypothetical protein